MKKQPERWLFVCAILLLSVLATVTAVSTLEQASFLAAVISAVVAVVALLALYPRPPASADPAVGGAVHRPRLRDFFTRSQWLTIVAGVLVCGLVGTAVASAGGDNVVTGDGTAKDTSISPSPAPSSPAVDASASEPSPTVIEESSETPFASDSPTETPTDEPTSDVDGTRPIAPIVYLDSLAPAQGDRYPKAAEMSDKQYPRSVETSCWYATSNSVEWNVAGYREFTATLGIDDNAQQPSGRTAQFIFYDQDGRTMAGPIDVSLGRPKAVSIALKNAVRLKVTCSGRDTRTNKPARLSAVMGDALITKEPPA